jgi:hypothetical protein
MRALGLVLDDRFQATPLKTAFISAWEVKILCNTFESDVPRVCEKRLTTGRTHWQLGPALLADAVSVLAQGYGRCHVLHADWALQRPQDIFAQTVSENVVIWIGVVVQLYKVT